MNQLSALSRFVPGPGKGPGERIRGASLMQKRNKAIVAGLSVSAVAAAVALTGSTSAYYYDLETSENSIQACGFDLEYSANVTKGETQYGSAIVDNTGAVVIKNVAPGDSFDVTIDLKNVGNCAGTLWGQVTNVKNMENGLTEPEKEGGDVAGTEGELGDFVKISVPLLGSEGPTLNEIPWPAMTSARPMVEIPAGFDLAKDLMPITLRIDVPLGENAGDNNKIMTDSFELDFDLALVQNGQHPGTDLGSAAL
jgi:predicted ribosomally synthesized peptide with SipW-like signal peptide